MTETKDEIRRCAEDIAADRTTRDYVLAYMAAADPKAVYEAYVSWVETKIRHAAEASRVTPRARAGE